MEVKISIDSDEEFEQNLKNFKTIQFNNLYSKDWLNYLCVGQDCKESNYLKNTFMKEFYKGNKILRPSIENFQKWKIKKGYGQTIKLETLEFVYRQNNIDKLHILLEKLFQEFIYERDIKNLMNKVKNGKIKFNNIVKFHRKRPYYRFSLSF